MLLRNRRFHIDYLDHAHFARGIDAQIPGVPLGKPADATRGDGHRLVLIRGNHSRHVFRTGRGPATISANIITLIVSRTRETRMVVAFCQV